MEIKDTGQIVKGKRKAQDAGQRFSKTAIHILQVFFVLMSGFLAYQGMVCSYYTPKYKSEMMFLKKDFPVVHIGLFLLAIAVITRVCKILDKVPEKREKICRGVLLLACIWISVIGYLYIREHPYYPSGDQINTTAGAAYARDGNYLMFQKGGYIGLYEQQKGFLFLYEIFFTLFGDFNYGMAAKFHLGFYIITLLAGFGFLKIVAKKPIYRILYCLMMMFCIPYMIYLPYVYGDLPSVCFSMVLFWALAAYEQSGRKRYLPIAAVAGVLALMVRMNSWIILIAVGIGMILLALKRFSLRPILAALCIVLAAAGSIRAISAMYEYRSGYESGVGIPSILWVAMGLQETNELPGVYNRYQQSVFEQNGFDREVSTEIGKRYIAERLQEMWDNPEYTRKFFLEKVKSQWEEPFFGSMFSTMSFDDEVEIPKWADELYCGVTHDVIWFAANCYQSVIYFACFAFALVSLFRKWNMLSENCAGWIPLIAVVGGFLFCFIWENKSRYMMPYYMFLILYAPMGLGTIAGMANEMIDKHFRKQGTEATKKSNFQDFED